MVSKSKQFKTLCWSLISFLFHCTPALIATKFVVSFSFVVQDKQIVFGRRNWNSGRSNGIFTSTTSAGDATLNAQKRVKPAKAAKGELNDAAYRGQQQPCSRFAVALFLSKDDENENDNFDGISDSMKNKTEDYDINETGEDDDDVEGQTAYGNRSLAWTNRYRKLLPYEHARSSAMQLGLRCKEEWEDYLADGRVFQRGAYLPSRPDEMYSDDWVSWEEFLGIMRTYDDTKQIVQTVLQLKNITHYKAFVKADTKRAEGLRIPAMPEIVYRDKGWTTYEDFFGCSQEQDGDFRCHM